MSRTVFAPAGGGGGGSTRHVKYRNYIAPEIWLNSSSWTDVFPGTDMDITLPAAAGDVIRCDFNGQFNGSVQMSFDVWTVVNGVRTNPFGGTLYGVAGWNSPSGGVNAVQGSAYKALVAGDIHNDTVTLRMRYKGASATNKIMYSDSTRFPQFAAENLGPAAA